MDYIVKTGDSLYSIGQRFGVDPGYIARFNNLWSTDIYAGQRLRIPLGADPFVLEDIYSRLDNLDERVRCLEEKEEPYRPTYPRTYPYPYGQARQ